MGRIFTAIALLISAAIGNRAMHFTDVGPESGITFRLDNGATPEKRMIETMAGGLAIFDYDGDGKPDIFLTNGASVPSLKKTDAKFYNRLYRNEGGFHFRDVTEKAGVHGEGYAMGAAAADYDNDGHPDLFVAGVNRNQLLHNRGDGTFEDVTAASGIRNGPWAVAAGWFDYDGDGRLDLWVVHYSDWTANDDRYCGDKSRGLRIYCHPKYFAPLPNTLYRNLGNGRFEDVSNKAGIGTVAGRGMSVVFADYDNDGHPDVFVTNDNMPNFLFHNHGDGTFEETALLAGVALREDGKPVASMGADFRDYDNDGRPDLFFTALAAETFPLFRNVGGELFNDVTYGSHVGALSLQHSGWGAILADFDNDGWKDIATANSHVNDLVEKFEPAVYREPDRIFRNTGKGSFEDATEEAGFREAKAHRGSGYADLDGDGKLDLAVSSLGEPVEVWKNDGGSFSHWLDVRLIGTRSNRDAIGAVVHVGDQVNQMTSSVSYASSSLVPVHFGLGSRTKVDTVDIVWPSGRKQRLLNVNADHILEVKEPTGNN